jgi:hypothetical protein
MIPLCLAAMLQTSILPLSDIAIGSAQVELFMVDRPDTAPIIRRNPALHDFLVGSFAGVRTGCRSRLSRFSVKWNCLSRALAS